MKLIHRKCKKDRGTASGTQAMPPILTIVIIIAVISFILIAKGGLLARGDRSIPVSSANLMILGEDTLNETETDVLQQLYQALHISVVEQQEKDSQYLVYFDVLRTYFKSSDFSLSASAKKELSELMSALNEIIRLEQLQDIRTMSLDGREVATYLLSEIYSICRLKITFGLLGDIERIEMGGGTELYAIREASVQSVHIDTLIKTIIIAVILLIICIFISNKNHLYQKEVIYDGVKKKRYA